MEPQTKKILGLPIPTKEELVQVLYSFSQKERLVFAGFIILLVFSFLFFIYTTTHLAMTKVPARGGSFSEGIIGTPRFVNPVLALSDADRDVTMLVYSGLVRKTIDGGYVPDLAKNFEISPDGLQYTFELKDGLTFHDGEPLTTEDIEFTVARAKDPTLKSPRRAQWEGVTVSVENPTIITFTLRQPYAQFLDNATLGILPKHVWKDVPIDEFSFSDFNISGPGSGPYEITVAEKSSAGIPNYYKLDAFKDFSLGRAYIETMYLRFFGNEELLVDALRSGAVTNANSLSPQEVVTLRNRSGIQVKNFVLPRVYGIFFNQSSADVFTEYAVRKALSQAVNRKEIVDTVLFGYGIPLYGPLPKSGDSLGGVIGNENVDHILEARKTLEQAGWKYSEADKLMVKTVKKATSTISVSVSTADRPELRETLALVRSSWEKLGIKVEEKIYEAGDLSQNVIRPRKYDALLFGEIIGRDTDPFAFWHSSQRNDPGLNIALYANSTVDKILETARVTLDATERAQKYADFEAEVARDIPAVFLYSPEFIYVLSKDIQGMDAGELTLSAERFLNVYEWYIDTDYIWKIFNK